MAIEDLFPLLNGAEFIRTSDQDAKYNCVAWAAGRSNEWWDIAPGYCWPDGVPRDCSLENIVKVFQGLGFNNCDSDALEQGFEKVAIYGDEYMWTHVARQLATGKWTSKIGSMEDIEHDALAGLCGDEYGKVMRVLKRKLP